MCQLWHHAYLPLAHCGFPLGILLMLECLEVLGFDVINDRLQVDLHVVIPCSAKQYVV